MSNNGGKEKVESSDSMAAAGRKMLRQYLAALRANEDGARIGEDPEAVHDMRVADRRMRAVLHMLEPYVPGDIIKQMLDDIRSLHRALGAVRDMDVLLGLARDFQATLPEEQQGDLDGLLDDWGAERKRARKKMRRALDSAEYQHFLKGMDAFLAEADTAPDESAGAAPHQVRHVMGSAIWERYEAVRAYETVMAEPTNVQLHALRITGKYLRYTLEFYRDVLPDSAGTLIQDVVQMQDQLGNFHDADVMVGLIHDYQEEQAHQRRKHDPPIAQPGLTAYLADREAAVGRIRGDFAPLWAKLTGPAWRKKLATATAAV